MNSMRCLLLLALLFFAVSSNAQIESLPETATGARALPAAHVEISWWGAMIWGQIANSSVK